MRTTVTVLLGCILASAASGGWFWNNPYPTLNDHKDCCFVSADTGYSAGWFGMVLKTVDGGQTWEQLATGTDVNLTDIVFPGSADTGYVSGPEFLKTTDGGASWSRSLPDPRPSHLSFPVGARCGYATGGTDVVLKTTDYGETWTDVYTPAQGDLFWDVCFVNLAEGYAAGGLRSDSGVICRTTDGGQTWDRHRMKTRHWIEGVSFQGNTGLACGYDPVVFRTSDRGDSWTSAPVSTTDALSDVYLFPDLTTGLVCSYEGHIWRTTDGGMNWTCTYPYGGVLNSFSFPGGGPVGYAVGDYGVLLKTTDRGATWSDLVRGPRDYFYEVEFPFGPDTGFAFGYTPNTSWRTTDAGATWQRYSQDSSRIAFECVSMPLRQSRVAYGVGYGNGIWRTSDNGASWQKSPIGATRWLKAVDFPLDTLTGFAVAAGGYIYRTTTGGDTWLPLVSGTTDDLNGVDFIDGQTGFAAGAGGRIIKTTNGGDTWVVLNSGVSQTLQAVAFPVDADTGYVVGSPPAMVLKTTDGGMTWGNKLSAGSEALMAVCFPAGCRVGFAVSGNGYIWRTTDYGETWNSTRVTHLPIYDVTFPPGNADTGYAVGQRGLILKTTDGGGTWIAEERPTPEASSRTMAATIVRGVLNLGVGSRQHSAYGAEMLDISGRKVLDLHPGPNDVSHLAPGVYFVWSDISHELSAVRKVLIQK